MDEVEPIFRPRSVTLENEWVKLEPLRPGHAPSLYAIGQDPATWRYLSRTVFFNEVDAARWVSEVLAAELAGTRIPFVIRRQSDQHIVGTTSFFDIRIPERALEIGHTWLAPPARACFGPTNGAPMASNATPSSTAFYPLSGRPSAPDLPLDSVDKAPHPIRFRQWRRLISPQQRIPGPRHPGVGQITHGSRHPLHPPPHARPFPRQ